MGEELSSGTVQISDIVDTWIRVDKQVNELTKGLDCSRDDFAFFVVKKLNELGVQVLVCLLRAQVLSDERQLPADLFAHFPVEILANVGDKRQEVLLESCDFKKRIFVSDRPDQERTRSAHSQRLRPLRHFLDQSNALLNEELLTGAVLTPCQDGQELREDADPGLQDLPTPLVEHFLREAKDKLSELVIKYLSM